MPGHDRINQMSADPMHTVVDVLDNIIKLQVGETDNEKVCNAEEALGRFQDTYGCRHRHNQRKDPAQHMELTCHQHLGG